MRTVREGLAYTEQCRTLKVDIRRLDEVLAGTVFAVAKAPDYFPEVPDTDLRIVPVGQHFGIPALRIYYRWNPGSEYVDLEWIEEVTDDPDDPVA